jgi:hypothetical protein
LASTRTASWRSIEVEPVRPPDTVIAPGLAAKYFTAIAVCE